MFIGTILGAGVFEGFLIRALYQVEFWQNIFLKPIFLKFFEGQTLRGQTRPLDDLYFEYKKREHPLLFTFKPDYVLFESIKST